MYDNWFLQTGLMDVVRTLLVFGLIFAIWELPAPGLIKRPVRDFVHWGLKYPFLFLVMAAVTLIVWGVIGRDYGLQILFLHDDPLVQFQLGIAMSLLILGINFHYFVLDTTGSGWRQSLELTIRVCRGFNRVLPAGRPIHTVLHNGFLEYLRPGDLDRIETALCLATHRDATEEGGLPWWRRTIDAVGKPRFRVLFAPAVLMVNAIPIVVLLGVVTSAGEFPARWAWLLGIATGAVGAVVLGCYTSRWLAVAKGWEAEAIEIRELLTSAEDVDLRSGGTPEESRGRSLERWSSPYVIAFFVVHTAVFGAWSADPPKPGDAGLQSPLAILACEAAAAVFLVPAWRFILAPLVGWGLHHSWRRVRVGLESQPEMTARGSLPWWIGLGMAAVAACLAWGWTRAGSPDIAPALVALAMMSVFLLNWLICFLLTTSYDLRSSAKGPINPAVVCGVAATGILGILLCLRGQYQLAGICGAPALLIGGFGISGQATEALARRHRLTRAAWLAVASALFVLVLWRASYLPTSIWLMFGILSVAAFALSSVARSDRPAMIYPASAIFAYVAFAILYNSLAEDLQALLPAGASLIVLLGLAASLYMVIKFSHPRHAALGCLALIVGVFAINGNAWKVDPNHFKLQFPNLERYYQGREGDDDDSPDVFPTFLDTRAYVRSTVSSIVKLRHADLEQEQNRQINQGDNEKLGSVKYEILRENEQEGKKLGSVKYEILRENEQEGILLGIRDPRGRFRAAPGDSISLILPDRPFGVTNESPGPTWSLRSQDVVDERPTENMLRKALIRAGGRIRVWFNPADGSGVGLLHFDPSVPGQTDEMRYEATEDGDAIVLKLHGMDEKAVPPIASVAPIFKGHVVVRIGPEAEKFNAVVHLEGTTKVRELLDPPPMSSTGTGREHREATRREITIGEDALQRLIEESHLVLERQDAPLPTGQALNEPALQAALEEWEKQDAEPGNSIEFVDRRGEWPVVLGTFYKRATEAPGLPPAAGERVIHAETLKKLAGLAAGGTIHREWDLQLMPSPTALSRIPHSGKSLIIVADVGDMLSFRIFDGEGKMVVDTNESRLREQARPIGDLRKQLAGLWTLGQVTGSQKDPIIAAVQSIVGYGYFLRVAHDRGMFRAAAPEGTPATISPGPSTKSARFSRGERVRKNDRLIVRWRETPEGPERSRVVQVMSDGNHPEAGSSTFQLAPWPQGEASQTLWTDDSVAGTWQIARPLDNVEVLEAWRRRVSPSADPDGHASRSKPPLVIVTVSGGGIRSSVWTTTVLKTLEDKNGLGSKFPYHIRLITGASGGMVAAAHFAASLPEPPAPGSPPLARNAQLDAASHLADDQLSAVAGCLVFNDIPGMLNPVQRRVDRGRKMEETWSRLTAVDGKSAFQRPLRGLIADELAGWRPSLVFTPMLVEDGRRLLISNLDLSFVARNYGRMILEQDSRKLDPSYKVAFGPRFVDDDDILSLSAVEFYRLFPQAWDFRVSTAVRMSASFPWIAPAVSLPTFPPRRVVDAGYYDNYGINLASQWLIKQRSWLRENTSGVVVIQIRDGVSQSARTSINFDLQTESRGTGALGLLDRITWGAPDGVLIPGLYPVNTPLQGISSARQWSMSFRNDEQVEMFDTLLRTAGQSNHDSTFFRTVVFECPVPASLSWSLSQREKDWIQRGLPSSVGDGDLKAELERLDRRRGWKEMGENEYIKGQTKIYRDALKDLHYQGLDRFSLKEIKDIYANLMNNSMRLKYLKLWWDDKTGR